MFLFALTMHSRDNKTGQSVWTKISFHIKTGAELTDKALSVMLLPGPPDVCRLISHG